MNRRIPIWLALCAVVTMGLRAEAARGVLSEDAKAHGKKLAELYCSTCHIVPAPDVLDRVSWEIHALPWMASYLGIYDGFYKSNKLNAARAAGVAWSEAPLHPNDFNAIAAYYQLSAPRFLYDTNRAPVVFPTTAGFRLRRLRVSDGQTPAATMVHISKRDGRTFVGQEVPSRLMIQRDLPRNDIMLRSNTIPVAMFETDSGLYYSDIGKMTPDFGPIGKVIFMPRKGEGFGEARVVLDELPRTGRISPADLNMDGRLDILVCSFGFFGGELAWHEGMSDGGFQKHVLFHRAGAVKAEARDLNGDGLPDIAVLMAQAMESMFYLYNDGKGGFAPEPMFHQHPAFGHCDFELADFDGDGEVEVVAVNGDLDYDAGPRPYHGVRIYRGNAPMKEVYFLQMPGAYSVEVADFDGDGDQDLAVVSFTPGFGVIRTPRTVFLENQGDFRFHGWELPFGNSGRWFIMDSGDIDADGDIDLLVGGLYNAPGGMAPSNEDVAVAFGGVPNETLLLENVFNESPEERRAFSRRSAVLGGSVAEYSWLPRR
ncbi:MAG: FG-GAP repeat domain-containing protein [Limisphaerales bacterium]